MSADRDVPFPYMRWAKRHLTGFTPSNLGMSGIAGLTPTDIAPVGPTPYWMPEGEFGDPDLRAALAARDGVPADHVFVSAGASLANFLVYLAEARGAHVAVETPGYEALPRVAAAVGAGVTGFRRDPARGWRVDAGSLRAAVRPNTRLIVVTDLHNPSGARLHADDLALLVAEAERVGAAVLVDEVYRELDLTVRPTAALGRPRVIVTNSLTKAHGLGGLRIGWILATPDRIQRIAEWNDLVCPAHPVPSIAVAKAGIAGLWLRTNMGARWVRVLNIRSLSPSPSASAPHNPTTSVPTGNITISAARPARATRSSSVAPRSAAHASRSRPTPRSTARRRQSLLMS